MKDTLKNILTKHYHIPKASLLERALKNLSPVEKIISTFFAVFLIIGAGSLLYKVNVFFLNEIPAPGGELREGIIGSPRFINPLLSLSDADRDLTMLIYSGFLKPTPEGKLIPDLASGYTISTDGLSYTFTIRPNATFHDGTPVLADDVVFTVQKAQDTMLKSPKRASWEGVGVEKKGDRIVTFTLKQPYAPFLENATLGILPKHLWKDSDSEQFTFSPKNIDAIGSGPYKVTKNKRTASGIPYYVELSAFPDYMLEAPYIKRIAIYFYPNEKELLSALARGEIESASTITPQVAKTLEASGARVERTPLPRVFGVFFNQNQSTLLAEKSVRRALELATDKQRIVDKVLYGYGVPIEGPVPPTLQSEHGTATTSTEARLAEADELLTRAKWIRNPKTGIRERVKGKTTERLSFSLVTGNIPELRESAELLKEMWEKIGAEVRLQIFESGDLNQNVIRPRKFDALLFGEIIGRDLDLFAFWHSSQRNDPGLNIASYTNTKVDKLLEEARRTADEEKRDANYRSVVSAISADEPAIFLYSPEFIYVLPKKIKGFALRRTTIPSERFLDIHHWYVNTEKVWNIFTK